eukprot:11393707-Alexandrium_andersonii.AAC.1
MRAGTHCPLSARHCWMFRNSYVTGPSALFELLAGKLKVACNQNSAHRELKYAPSCSLMAWAGRPCSRVRRAAAPVKQQRT